MMTMYANPTIARPPCKVTGCTRLAYAARGYCWKCYNRALRELRKWKEEMELRRWLVGRGLVPTDDLGRTSGGAVVAGWKARGGSG